MKARAVFTLSVCALLVPRSLFAAGGFERNGFDSDDLGVLTRRDPALGALFLRGEAELHAGSARAAAETFEQVVQRAPDSSLAERRLCQALTELGRRQSAIEACQKAIERRASAPGFRALVGALMSLPPTPEQLVLATKLAAAARERMADQPWGLAATSEIAERTGDEKMLESAVLELERIAPGHYETVRARKALVGFRLPPWAWGIWSALGAAALGTLVHAAWSNLGRRRWRKHAIGTASALGIASALFAASPANAAPAAASADAPVEAPVTLPPAGGLSKWPVNDADPTKSLPTPEQRDRNPLEFGYHMMDLADKADIARRKGDFAAVGKYYEAMAIAVPDRAIGYRKSCEGYEQAGNLDKALALCRGALGADGVEFGDYTHFAKLVFAKPGPLSQTDAEDLSEIATHLKSEPGGMAAGLEIQCDLAERTDDVKRMEDCAAAVAKEAPSSPKLVVYQWGLAMKKEDYKTARALVETARKSALPPSGIAVMEQTTREQSAFGRRAGRAFRRHALAVGAGLAILLGVIFSLLLRRRFKLQPRPTSA